MCKGCEVYDFSSFAHFGHKKWSKKSLLKNIKSVGCKGFQVLSSSTLTCDSENDRLCLLQEFMASSDRILRSSFRFQGQKILTQNSLSRSRIAEHSSLLCQLINTCSYFRSSESFNSGNSLRTHKSKKPEVKRYKIVSQSHS